MTKNWHTERKDKRNKYLSSEIHTGKQTENEIIEQQLYRLIDKKRKRKKKERKKARWESMQKDITAYGREEQKTNRMKIEKKECQVERKEFIQSVHAPNVGGGGGVEVKK